MMDAVTQQTRHGEVCPLDTTLQLLAGKWKSIILCRLMQHELRYTQLLKTLPGCTRRMLSLQLAQLEADQIIQKQIDASYVPIKTSYRLTPLGKSLVPIIKLMDQWGEHYIQTVTMTEN